LRKSNINHIDILIQNIGNEISEIFATTNYNLEVKLKPIDMNGNFSLVELITPLVMCKPIPLSQYNRDETQFLPFRDADNDFNKVNIQNAKNTLRTLLKDNNPDDRGYVNIDFGFKRIEKMWQLISNYVSLYDSDIYLYNGHSEIGIFWSYNLLIVDKKIDCTFFLGVGASD
jgi:hypothetical protein